MLLSLLAACHHEAPAADTARPPELPLESVDTVGGVSCDDREALPLYAWSSGLTGGVVAVALEIAPPSGEPLAYALEEVWYYEWEGRYAIPFAGGCDEAAAAAFAMRWTLWSGEPDVVEALELEQVSDTGG